MDRVKMCREALWEERLVKEDKAENCLELLKISAKHKSRVKILLDTQHCPKGDEAPCRNCAYPLIRI